MYLSTYCTYSTKSPTVCNSYLLAERATKIGDTFCSDQLLVIIPYWGSQSRDFNGIICSKCKNMHENAQLEKCLNFLIRCNEMPLPILISCCTTHQHMKFHARPASIQIRSDPHSTLQIVDLDATSGRSFSSHIDNYLFR